MKERRFSKWGGIVFMTLCCTVLIITGCFQFVGPSQPGPGTYPTATPPPATPTPGAPGPGDPGAILTTSNITKMESSVIPLPASLISTSSSSSRMLVYDIGTSTDNSSDSNSSGGGGDMATGLYNGIRQYVGLANSVKEIVKGLMGDILRSSLLQDAELGVLYDLNETDPEAPKKVQVDLDVNATYPWKVSAYFNQNSTTPDLIIRFEVLENGAKGRLLWKRYESENLSPDFNQTINYIRYADVVFDGTTSRKTLEVKLVTDNAPLFAFAEDQNWSALTSSQKNRIDLGQPKNVFVNAVYENDVFTIHGTSYHPGWKKQSDLENGEESMNLGPGRSIYMFKAKAIGGTNEGAKIYLSIPDENSTDVSNVWTEDSFGNIYTNMMVKWVNDMIAEENNITKKDGIVRVIIGPTTYDSHDANFSSTEFDMIKQYYVYGDGNTTNYKAAFDVNGSLENVGKLNAAYLTRDNTTNPTKAQMFSDMALAIDINRTRSHGYTFTKTEIETFANTPNTDPNAQQFVNMFKSMKAVVNPAFYTPGGFIGTYDETNSTFYNYTPGDSNSTMTSGTAPTVFTALNALDLSSITPYTPRSVKEAVITVE